MKMLTVFGCLLAAAAAPMGTAQTVFDRLNHSAAACIPRSAAAFDGSGTEVLRWNDDAFRNHDDNDNEQLICSIPYDPALRRANGTIPDVEISVDVIDNHDGDEV